MRGSTDSAVDLHTVTCIARPPRVAVGVPDGVTVQAWCRVLQRVTDVWGGLDSTIYFPIDAWTPGSVWDRLLQRFDPDSILFHHDPETIDAFRERYDPLQCWTYRWLFHAEKGTLPVDWAAPLHVAARAWSSQPGCDPLAGLQNGDVIGGPESLHLLLAREFGRVSEEELTQITQPGGLSHISPIRQPLELADTADSARRAVDLAAAPEKHGASPSRWNSRGLLTLQDGGVEGWRDGPILVAGSATSDICLWLTLRTLRLGPSVLWWPDDMVPDAPGDTDDAAHGYVYGLASALYGPEQALTENDDEDDYDQDPIFLTSATLTQDQLQRRMQMILRINPSLRPPEIGFDPLPRLACRRFVAVQLPPEQGHPFTAGESHAYLTPELPLWMRNAGRMPTFLTEFRVDGFSAPAHPAVHPLVAPHRPPEIPQRSGRYGPVAAQFSRIVLAGQQHHLLPLQIRFPNITDIVGRYGTWLGGNAFPSNAGRLSRDVIERFGSLDDAAQALRTGPFAGVVQEFLRSYRRTDEVRAGSYPVRDGLYMDRDGLASIVSNSDGGIDPAMLLDDWTVRGLIDWGMLLKCPRCRFEAQYEWGDIEGAGVRCQRCGRTFPVTPATACSWEPVAGLDELVRASLENDAREEIVLAAWLHAQDQNGAVTLGIEWQCPGVNAESDVVGVAHGELILGEAKSTDTIEAKQCRQYENLARRVQARRLIFATSREQWADGVLSRMETIRTKLPGTSVESYVRLLADNGPRQVL